MSRILIADNDDLQSMALKKRIFAMKSYVDIESVNCGENAVEYCMRHVPDMMVINAFLPGISGFETAERVKELFPKVEICIVSSGRNLPMCKKALGIKARAFLEKPISDRALEDALKSTLKEFRATPDFSGIGKILGGMEQVVESRDFSRAYYESRKFAEQILELSDRDQEETGNILRMIKNRILGRYMEDPTDSSEFPDEILPVSGSEQDGEILVEAWVFRLLDHLFRYRFIRQHRIVKPVFAYIHSHMNESLNAAAVSEACHISQQYLLRLFKEQMKMSMLDYIQHYKIISV